MVEKQATFLTRAGVKSAPRKVPYYRYESLNRKY
jgi:hypothetical protein